MKQKFNYMDNHQMVLSNTINYKHIIFHIVMGKLLQ